MDLFLYLSSLVIASIAHGVVADHADKNEAKSKQTAVNGSDGMLMGDFDDQIMIADVNSSQITRSKRALGGFHDMIFQALGCDPSHYNGYGCFCGSGGSGEPLDGIDRCCQQHDECYLTTHCGSTDAEYSTPYSWDRHNGQVTCYAQGVSPCGQALCHCDKAFVECQSRQASTCPFYKPFCSSSGSRIAQNLIFNAFEFNPIGLAKTLGTKVLHEVAPESKPAGGIWSWVESLALGHMRK